MDSFAARYAPYFHVLHSIKPLEARPVVMRGPPLANRATIEVRMRFRTLWLDFLDVPARHHTCAV